MWYPVCFATFPHQCRRQIVYNFIATSVQQCYSATQIPFRVDVLMAPKPWTRLILPSTQCQQNGIDTQQTLRQPNQVLVQLRGDQLLASCSERISKQPHVWYCNTFNPQMSATAYNTMQLWAGILRMPMEDSWIAFQFIALQFVPFLSFRCNT